MSCSHERKYKTSDTVTRVVQMRVEGEDVNCTQYGTETVERCNDCQTETSRSTNWGQIHC